MRMSKKCRTSADADGDADIRPIPIKKKTIQKPQLFLHFNKVFYRERTTTASSIQLLLSFRVGNRYTPWIYGIHRCVDRKKFGILVLRGKKTSRIRSQLLTLKLNSLMFKRKMDHVSDLFSFAVTTT